jgi:N-acetyl-gamma-glutamyl-phosphate reductase
MQKIKAGIVGGAGYTGGELLRLLLRHDKVEISFVHSRSNSGKPVYHVHQDLKGETAIVFSDIIGEADVIFLCLGHGESKVFLEKNNILPGIKVIDLSQDFRLEENYRFGQRSFVYGLPELNKENIQSADNIANPGCFATALQLGLLPLAKKGLLTEVFSTGITGSTGAGMRLSESSHFSWRINNIQAYKSLSHQHLHEVNRSVLQLSGKDTAINFVPWRGDFARGIFVSSTLHCQLPLPHILEIFEGYYTNAPFTIVSEVAISMKQVVNTNKCLLQIEKSGDTIVVHSAIDNLLKGASGQAVQNMNIMFGIEETTGLNLKSIAF